MAAAVIGEPGKHEPRRVSGFRRTAVGRGDATAPNKPADFSGGGEHVRDRQVCSERETEGDDERKSG